MAKSYYETLGVPRNASELEIKSAYHRLARKYHPDKALPDVDVAALEAEFSVISTAYNVLKDNEKRKAYDQQLELQRQQETTKNVKANSTSSSSDRHPAATNTANNDKSKAVVARRAFAKGITMMGTGDYSGAVEFLEVAIRNNDQEPTYHARLALALLRSHRSFSRATEAAEKAIALDPYNSENRMILAELYENAGSKTMAIKAYEEILKWDPAYEKAHAALRDLSPKRSGLFSKFFQKKKS